MERINWSWLLNLVWLVPIVATVGLLWYRDRRERKKAVQRVVQAEKETAQDEALLSSLGEGIVFIDTTGKIIKLNSMAESLIGWKTAEVVGKSWSEVAPLVNEEGKKIEEGGRATERVIITKKTISSAANYYVRKDGTRFPVGTTAAPVIYEGKVIGVIAVFRDITKEKYIDKAKSEFVSLASHQLRTPLSSIRWFSEMLLNGDVGTLSKEQQEFVNNIYLSNERMIELVNSLLNISRIESGRIIVDPEPTELKKLVEEVVTELTPKLVEKKIRVVVSVVDNLPKINIDPKLIRQVYMNLLTNSIKYSPQGARVTVFISVNDREITSQVSDTGYGIPKKEQGRVFEKFYRGENVVKVEIDGTGLGLYLVKAIVESSGGRIWFESEEGKGTAFWFSLPLAGTQPKKGEVTLT